MAAGVLFEDHVVVADGLGFFLGRERHLVNRTLSSTLRLLRGNRCLSRPTLAGRLLTPIHNRLRISRRSLRPTGLLSPLQPSLLLPVNPRILYCDGRAPARSNLSSSCTLDARTANSGHTSYPNTRLRRRTPGSSRRSGSTGQPGSPRSTCCPSSSSRSSSAHCSGSADRPSHPGSGRSGCTGSAANSGRTGSHRTRLRGRSPETTLTDSTWAADTSRAASATVANAALAAGATLACAAWASTRATGTAGAAGATLSCTAWASTRATVAGTALTSDTILAGARAALGAGTSLAACATLACCTLTAEAFAAGTGRTVTRAEATPGSTVSGHATGLGRAAGRGAGGRSVRSSGVCVSACVAAGWG